MANGYAIHSFERALLVPDVFSTVGANASRTTSSPIEGVGSLLLAYPSGTTTWNTQTTGGGPSVRGGTARKVVWTIKFSYSPTPAADACIFQLAGKKIFITTGDKIKVDTTTLTMSAMTPGGTIYTLEAMVEPDSGGPVGSGLSVRFNKDDSTIATVAGTTLNLNFGEAIGKNSTGPNTNIKIDSVVGRASDSTTEYNPWLNSQSIDTTSRVPVATGNYDDFTGVGDTTNKYNNVDETPTDSDTTFNNDGEFGVTRRQTFTFTNVASYGSTVRCFVINQVSRIGPGQLLTGDIKTLIRFSSTDYTWNTLSTNQSYAPDPYGNDVMPDGSAISAANLNAIEAGYYINSTNTNYNGGFQYSTPTADGTTYDGVWTQTGGTGGSAYTAIDDGITDNDADYISGAAVGDKQGLRINLNVSPLTDIGNTIQKLLFNLRGRLVAGGTQGQIRLGFRTGGTDYPSDTSSLATFNSTSFATNANHKELKWSGSYNNPATGNPFTKTEIDAYEWYLEYYSGSGTAGIDISNFSLDAYCASNVMHTASFMEVAVGDAFTDNGLIKRPMLFTQGQSLPIRNRNIIIP